MIFLSKSVKKGQSYEHFCQNWFFDPLCKMYMKAPRCAKNNARFEILIQKSSGNSQEKPQLCALIYNPFGGTKIVLSNLKGWRKKSEQAGF